MVVNYLLAVLISKVSDSIWDEGLFNKLSTDQVNGQFLNIIQSMYKNSSSAVKLGNRCTHCSFYVQKAYDKDAH